MCLPLPMPLVYLAILFIDKIDFSSLVLAVRNKITCRLMSSYWFDRCVCLFVDIEIEPSVHLKCVVVYRPPNASYDSSTELFDCILKEIGPAKRFTIYGDFNLPDIDWSTCNFCYCKG